LFNEKRKAGNKKVVKGKDKELFPDRDPGPSQGLAEDLFRDEIEVDD
jgi:hypothetical protein